VARGAVHRHQDLIVDRGAFDRIIAAGGYISAPTGACVAACPNGSAALFLGAKIAHLGDLPQGQPERDRRAIGMIDQHDAEGFGGCTPQFGECTAVCPKGIQLDVISRYHRDVLTALRHGET